MSTAQPTGLDRRLAHIERPSGLVRALGVPTLVGIGLAAVIGSGIFVLSGQASARFAGPAIVISFLVAAAIAVLPALCFSELSTTMPVSGGAFAYTYTVFGPFVGWIVAWALLVEYIVGASVMAIGWSAYVENILEEFGAAVPGAIAESPFGPSPGVLNVPAAILVVLAGVLLLRGASESARANAILVAIKLGALILFVLVGAFSISADNWDPFIPMEESFGQFGISGILRGAGVVFLTYISFDVIATAAQEARNPGRSMPNAMAATLALAAILYVAVALVMTGLVNYTALNVPDPLSIALGAHPSLDWLRNLANAAAVAGLAAGVVSLLYGQSRIFMRMAREGLLPTAVGRVNPATESPRLAVLICMSAAAIIAAFGSYDDLAVSISAGTIVTYVLVCAAVIRLRRQRPDLPRPFRLPLGPTIPLAGVIGLLVVAALLPPKTHIIVGSWLVLGLVVWLLYVRRAMRGVSAPAGAER